MNSYKHLALMQTSGKLFTTFLSLLLILTLSMSLIPNKNINADHYCTVSYSLIYCPKHNSYAASSAEPDYGAAFAVIGVIVVLELIIDAGSSSSSSSYFIEEEEDEPFSPSFLFTGTDVIKNENFKLNLFKLGEDIEDLKNKENIDFSDAFESFRLFSIDYSF